MPRPAYRRGRGLRQHSFRISDEVIALLRAEAERRHVWMSALVEHVLLQALRPAAGAGDVAVQAAASGNRSSPRHWCRIAIDTPVWEGLLREANRRGMSFPQLIRQHLGGFGRAEFPVSDGPRRRASVRSGRTSVAHPWHPWLQILRGWRTGTHARSRLLRTPRCPRDRYRYLS